MNSVENRIFEELKESIKKLNYQYTSINLKLADNIEYGDLCTNIAFHIGSSYKKNIKEIGKEIVKNMKLDKDLIEEIKVEDNGFINIRLSNRVYDNYYKKILEKGEEIGKKSGNGIWKYIELVSANPTGFLHIGHLRNGIITDTLSNLYEYLGYSVKREYLINDAGSQIDKLINSFCNVWNRWSGIQGETDDEEQEYEGEALKSCAEYYWKKYKNEWFLGDKIKKSPLYVTVRKAIVDYYLSAIKEDLKKYKIDVICWKKESVFVTDKSINDIIRSLQNKLVMKDGAILLELQPKDEVLIKKSGEHTYFLQDLIYHQQKLNIIGQDDEVIDVVGADHYGHINRLKNGWELLGGEEKQLSILVMQLVQLKEEDKLLTMSKRNSNAIYINNIEEFMNYEEVRWYFNSQPISNALEIDITKLKNKDYNNKVFYVMYSHSRACGILRKANIDYRKGVEFKNLTLKEKEMLNVLMNYEKILDSISQTKETYQINNYLLNLSQLFNSYYEETNILESSDSDIHQRLAIVYSIKSVLKSGLKILKIDALEEI